MAAIAEHRAGKTVFGRMDDLSGPDAIMLYKGRLNIDAIRGTVYLNDLPCIPSLDEALSSGEYETEIRVIRRVPKA